MTDIITKLYFMIRLILLTLLLFLGCTKEQIPQTDISDVQNTHGWRITEYYVNGVRSNMFDGYVFSISDNIQIECADYFDGTCSYGVFGGYIDIIQDNQKYRVNILLPEVWNLQNITGFWDVIVINGNTIHLIRVRVAGKEEIYFKRF